MSDGPHKSLPMPRAWKKLAECADKTAYHPDEVTEAARYALERDWQQEVPKSFLANARKALDQLNLFPEHLVIALQKLRTTVAGNHLCNLVLDYAIHAAREGKAGEAALHDAVKNAAIDYTARRSRQVEEHYLRKARRAPLERSRAVRRRLNDAFQNAQTEKVVKQLIDPKEKPAHKIKKRNGLDDGVEL